jgi:hypothetical protein
VTIYKIDVRLEDERGRRDAVVLVKADLIEEAQEAGLEFARSHVFFGAKAEYVEWLQASNIEFPYVMRVDALEPTRKRKQTNTGGES